MGDGTWQSHKMSHRGVRGPKISIWIAHAHSNNLLNHLENIDVESSDKLLLQLFSVTFGSSHFSRVKDVDRWPFSHLFLAKTICKTNGLKPKRLFGQAKQSRVELKTEFAHFPNKLDKNCQNLAKQKKWKLEIFYVTWSVDLLYNMSFLNYSCNVLFFFK